EPNERLPRDDELATAFGVSAITVRRALRDLMAEGIVVRRPGRGGGTFVAAEPPRDALRDYEIERALLTRHVWDLFEYRKILELGIVQVAARIASTDDVVELRRAVDAMAKAKDWAAFRPLDRGFHLALARSARSGRALEELTAVLRRLAQLYFPDPLDYLRASNDDHRAIVDAISDGDATTAAEAVDRHIEAAKDTFSWIARGPDCAPS
ncbi:MAG: FCD domain-containing protein, partial [Actinobacteria bacterium]|nr:FCD domain-containing protein [Actinomycetota bacterium]